MWRVYSLHIYKKKKDLEDMYIACLKGMLHTKNEGGPCVLSNMCI